MKREGTVQSQLKSTFANSGRIAGTGISSDRYDEESGWRPQPHDTGRVKLLSDTLSYEERQALHGEVKIIKRRNV
jgi:hypothetical protein